MSAPSPRHGAGTAVLEAAGTERVDRAPAGATGRRAPLPRRAATRPDPPGGEPDRRPGWRPRPPWSRTTVARLVQLVGVVDAVTAVLPAHAHHGRLALVTAVVPTAGVLTAGAATGVVGVLLVYLGAGLRHGRRRAWELAVAGAAAGTVLHVPGGGVRPAVSSALLLVLLVATRGMFRAPADAGSRRRALRAFGGLLGAGFVLGFAEVALHADRLAGDPGVRAWAGHVALGLAGVGGPLRFTHPAVGQAVALTTGAFGLAACAVTAVLLLRPRTRPVVADPAGQDRLRDLLERHGAADSLGYFALRGDKMLVWAPSGRAAVAYRVVNGVSLASGDPVGLPSAWPDAVDAWLADCTAHGWTPAVLACGRAGGTAYRRAGLDVVELGDEAVVDVAAFSLQGRPMRGVRQAVGRMRRAGYACTVVRQRDLDPDVLAEAVRRADELRDGAVERGFSMALSRLGDPRDGDCLLVLCRDGDGRLRGLLHFVPWGPDGLSLDLMRGDRTADNGLTELMIVSAVEAAPGLGVRRVSLNFAVLRSVFARAEELGAGPVVRVWARLLRLASRLWQLESLYRANAKYQPRWQPRYLCFPTARDLPRIGLAALDAEAFLPRARRHRGPAGPRPVAR